MKHECSGRIYHKKCPECAIRLLLTTTSNGPQEAGMLFYLCRYHGHDKDELELNLEIARPRGLESSS